jgi:hypothetical protein
MKNKALPVSVMPEAEAYVKPPFWIPGAKAAGC